MDFAEFLDQYGLPIAMLIALAVGRFVPGFVYSERKKEADESRAEVARLNEKMIGEVSPALARQADVVERAMGILAEIQDDRRIQDRVDELDRMRQHQPHPPPPSPDQG